MEFVFWTAAAMLAWTYFLFPLTMLAWAELRKDGPVPALEPGAEPTVSVVLAVRNEAAQLPQRIENLLAQDYPEERLEVLVACNACSDGSVEVAAQIAARNARVRVLVSRDDQGKAGALNLGADHAKGEILVFADARQRFALDAVRRLVEAFAEPGVGAVSGRLVIGEGEAAAVRGIGVYWGLETRLRLAQSRTGSVMGATGAIYAVRRALYASVPANLILDDVFVPMQVVMRGFQVALRPEAVAHDRPATATGSEYRRKLRTMTGNLQLLRAIPGLLSPVRNPFFVRYISHKVLRVLSPLAIVALLISGIVLQNIAYGLVAALVASFLLAGAAGLVYPSRLLSFPAAFAMVQWAALMALLRPRRDAAELWSGTAPVATAPGVRTIS